MSETTSQPVLDGTLAAELLTATLQANVIAEGTRAAVRFIAWLFGILVLLSFIAGIVVAVKLHDASVANQAQLCSPFGTAAC